MYFNNFVIIILAFIKAFKRLLMYDYNPYPTIQSNITLECWKIKVSNYYILKNLCYFE